MKRLVYNSYDKLAEDMIDVAADGGTAGAVLFYDDAIALIKALLQDDDTTIKSLRISDTAWDGYDLEYYVSIDDNFEIFAEQAWVDEHTLKNGKVIPGGYLSSFDDRTFIDGDANSAILKVLDTKSCFEIELDIEDDEDIDIDIDEAVKELNRDEDSEDEFDDEFWDLLLDNTKVQLDRKGCPIGLVVNVGRILDKLI